MSAACENSNSQPLVETLVEKSYKKSHCEIQEVVHDSISECSATSSEEEEIGSETEIQSAGGTNVHQSRSSKRTKLDYPGLAQEMYDHLRGKDCVLTLTTPDDPAFRERTIWHLVRWSKLDEAKKRMLALGFVLLMHPPMERSNPKSFDHYEYPDLTITEALTDKENEDFDFYGADAMARELTGQEISTKECNGYLEEISSRTSMEYRNKWNCGAVDYESWT